MNGTAQFTLFFEDRHLDRHGVRLDKHQHPAEHQFPGCGRWKFPNCGRQIMFQFNTAGAGFSSRARFLNPPDVTGWLRVELSSEPD